MKLLLIHGPNLNMLGTREPEQYGKENFDEINKMLYAYCFRINVELEVFQSNSEGEIVTKIQQALNNFETFCCGCSIVKTSTEYPFSSKPFTKE